MACERYRDWLLDPTSDEPIDRHLATCTDCSTLAAELAENERLLASLEVPEPGSRLTSRLARIANDRLPCGVLDRSLATGDLAPLSAVEQDHLASCESCRSTVDVMTARPAQLVTVWRFWSWPSIPSPPSAVSFSVVRRGFSSA